ncbi:16S rRNA (uracil(1498)-N(3))-methyltransferase [Ureaplasma sp. ES3154-GEN]|uniref:RsmE family RNA methyltransferase n=1 Tax=Ureaplasma sp. ES3154-GEN TaxID=2984844 RepID=UPI0021E72789|nr:16S rRNA (uracil(1498)-N(3))-methyltransferase [Ureaplasma sp. ES3154-GEN]MCV3743499.1 16S rRNA (uracil(1498)-N(3))-methyltransferase [Ureaplasma sp. ES3154-GEN]
MHQYNILRIDRKQHVIFDPEDVFKITKVHRIRINEEIYVLWNNKKYLAVIRSIAPLRAEVLRQIQANERRYSLDVYLGSLKPKPFEDAVNKLVQLNVYQIHQLILDRTYDEHQIRTERIQKITNEATSQSKRYDQVLYYPNIPFNKMLSQLHQYDAVFVANEKNEEVYLYDLKIRWSFVKNVAIIIGGEGGFTGDEITRLKANRNVYMIKLTPTILRAETAAVYLTSVLDQFLNYQRREDETKVN